MNNPIILIVLLYLITRFVWILIFFQLLHWLIHFPDVTLSLTFWASVVILKLMDWTAGSIILESEFDIEEYMNDKYDRD